MRKTTLILCILSLVLLAAGGAQAGWYASTDRFGYTGTVNVYDTLSDAQNGTNARNTAVVVPQRDLGLYLINGVPSYDANFTGVLTSWWYTTDQVHGVDSGWGNPSNTNTGFVQLYDDNSSTVTSSYGGWTNANYNTFQISVSGQNADVADYARFWHAPGIGGTANLTAGTFLNYSLEVIASGLNGVYDSETGLIVSEANHPSGVTGSFKGIFENTNTSDLSYKGFYVFDLGLNMTNWSYDNRSTLNGAFYASEFAAPAVPEPMSIMLGIMGLGSIAGFRKIRK